MNIAKGIVGIKTLKTDNRIGWHVFADDTYMGWHALPALSIIELATELELMLIGFIGNTLHFNSNPCDRK